MSNEQRARNLLMEIWDAPDRETGFAPIDTAFAEIKSDTLRDAENAAFEALTRHGFTGARYCVIAAIRGLIDDPAKPAPVAARWETLEMAARIASGFSMKPDRSLHPDIAWEDMAENVQMAAHSTAQSIAMEIRALSAEPAAPDPTKALVNILREVESFLSDPRIGTVNYMESQLFYTDCGATLDKVRTALRLAEDGG